MKNNLLFFHIFFCCLCSELLPAEIEKEYTHPDVLLRDAFLAKIKKDDRTAIKLFEKYLAIGKESAYVHGEFARVLSRNRLHARAITEARKAINLNPGDSLHAITYATVLKDAGKREEAIIVLESGLRKYENNVELEYYLAEVQYALNQYGKAKVHYKQVLFQLGKLSSRGPLFRNVALWRLANIYLKENDHERSRIYLVRFVQHNQQRLFARFLLGYYLYFRRGNFDKAKSELEILLQYRPEVLRDQGIDMTFIYLALGEIYFLNQDYRAIVFLKKVLRKRKNNYLIKALILQLNGKNKKALYFLIPFLKKNHTNFIARVAFIRILEKLKSYKALGSEYLLVASLALKQKRHRIGIDFLRRGLELKNNHRELKISKSQIFQRLAEHYEALDQPNRTILYLRKSISRGNREKRLRSWKYKAELNLILARLLAGKKIKRYSEAITLCEGVIRKHPEYAQGFYIRGLVYHKTKKLKRAIFDFSKAIELQKSNYLYYYFRAMVYYDIIDFKQTEINLKKVLSLKENFAEANNFLGYLYAEKGMRLKTASRLIHKAIEIVPTNGSYQDSLGWVFFQLKEWQKARYHLQLAALLLKESGIEDPVVYDHLGDVYSKLKMAKHSLKAYNRALFLLKKEIMKQKKINEKINQEKIKLRKKLLEKIDSISSS